MSVCRQVTVSPSTAAKPCSDCGVLRSAAWFACQSKAPDGLMYICSSCGALRIALRAEHLAATARTPEQKTCRAC